MPLKTRSSRSRTRSNSPVLGNFGTLVRTSDYEGSSIENENTQSVGSFMQRSKSCLSKQRSRRHSLRTVKPGNMNKSHTEASLKVKSDSNSNKDDKEHVQEENGVWFWVNKNGFPIDDSTWERMWDHVAKIHPGDSNEINIIRDSNELPQIPIPQVPHNLPAQMPVAEKLERIQNYMRDLQYNHTGTQFFEIKKNRPISGLMESAREMIKEALPIKCLEAVILGIFLTNGMMGVERFPISFKSTFGVHVHRHVVLGIYYGGCYGAIGMSRREDLMYKSLEFKSLSDLIFDFHKYYTKFHHDLKKVKVGLPIPHDPHSFESIPWKCINLNMPKTPKKEIIKELDIHAREIRNKARSWSMPPGTVKRIATVVDTLKDTSGSSNSNIKSSDNSKSYPVKPQVLESGERQTSLNTSTSDYLLRI